MCIGRRLNTVVFVNPLPSGTVHSLPSLAFQWRGEVRDTGRKNTVSRRWMSHLARSTLVRSARV